MLNAMHALNRVHVIQRSPDEHVFIVIECPERPTVSIDIMNHHGRRGLGIRVDGMSISDTLLDLKELPPKGESLFRYCGMCGEKIQLLSSGGHECEEQS